MNRNRHSIRLPNYDYAQPGGYFVSIVTQGRACLFGEIVDGEMRMNRIGRIVLQAWQELPKHYPHVILDEFVVMPNHVHGIIFFTDDSRRGGSVQAIRPLPEEIFAGKSSRPDDAQTRPYARHGLPEIVRAFKSFSARYINYLRKTPGISLWQRNYYEHVIRDERDLNDIRGYIRGNPAGWDRDEENLP